jgi:hypothetical protein
VGYGHGGDGEIGVACRGSHFQIVASRSYNARHASESVLCCGAAVIRRHGVHNTGSITSVATTCTEIVEGRTDSAWGGLRVQVIPDAPGIFNATKTNGMVVVMKV